MKSCLGSAAAFLLLGMVDALEKPMLKSTADYQESWEERPFKDDMVSQLADLKYTKMIDHGKRPVIGVLTEPLRGDLLRASDKSRVAQYTDDDSAGYVPRAHVQFIEQAGVRVVPIDYRLSRDELVNLFDQLNGIYLPGDSQLAVTDETYKGAFVIAMAYAENAAFETKEHWPVFLMGNSLGTWVRAK